ncbi:type IV secretory system conjugative DNA transfer family protein [Halarcobacter sp.]|uniref:type IV secretory system conjugative DNA transfer family protein n=1 Tax=Halarcobacter sp. TaxID=2321133 RepID=UPI003A91421B
MSELEKLFKALELRIENNKTITELKDGGRIAVTCNNKPIKANVNYIEKFSIRNRNQFIVFNTHEKLKDCSYIFLEKYIHKSLSSKISFIVATLLKLSMSPELYNQVKSQKLKELLLKLVENEFIDFESNIKDNLLEKWEKITKKMEERSLEDGIINLTHSIDSICVNDEKLIEYYKRIYKIKDNEKVTFFYFDSFISVCFPLYGISKKIKDNLLSSSFNKNELEVLKAIFKYIFQNIDKKNAYSLLDKPLLDKIKDEHNTKKYFVTNLNTTKTPTILLIETFNSLASHIDTILDDIVDIDHVTILDKKFNLNLSQDDINNIKENDEILPNANLGSIEDINEEIKVNPRIDFEQFLKQLNKPFSKVNQQIKKTKEKIQKIQTSENMGVSFSSMPKIDTFKNYSNILDPTNENFKYMIPIKERLRNTYALAGSGGGKTSLLESLLYDDCQKLDQSIIVFDLMGKATNSLLKFVDDPNRLLIVNPYLHKSITPIINPFEIENRNDELAIETRTKAIINGSDIALKLKDGWSINQGAMLEPCISTLIREGGYSFEDLQRMMNDERNSDLIALGKKSPIKAHRDFFNNEFNKESYKVTKDAISARIQVFLNDPTFANLTTGKSTINLNKEINKKGKIIVFKLPSKQRLFARLMMEMIQDIMKERVNVPDKDIVPTHIYLDEFQNYVTPTIEEMLSESRNYMCYTTFAHQSFVQLSKKMQGIVLSNSNIKIIGQCSYDDGRKMAKEMKADLETIENLQQAEFVLKVGAKPAVKIKNTDRFVNDKTPYHHKRRTKHMKYQLKQKYYVYKKKLPMELDNNIETIQLAPKYNEF